MTLGICWGFVTVTVAADQGRHVEGCFRALAEDGDGAIRCTAFTASSSIDMSSKSNLVAQRFHDSSPRHA